MTDAANTPATAATETKKGRQTVYNTVTMDDGRIVDFPGKRKLLKTSELSSDKFTVTTRFDFVNGETRVFKIRANQALFSKFAAHGIEQKVGDEVAGLEEVDDMVLAVEEVIDRLLTGEWSARREVNGLAGTSILAKALIKTSGKTPAEIKAFLKDKTTAQKLALRNNPKLVAVIAELEAEKKPKADKPQIDTDALLAELS